MQRCSRVTERSETGRRRRPLTSRVSCRTYSATRPRSTTASRVKPAARPPPRACSPRYAGSGQRAWLLHSFHVSCPSSGKCPLCAGGGGELPAAEAEPHPEAADLVLRRPGGFTPHPGTTPFQLCRPGQVAKLCAHICKLRTLRTFTS